MRFFFSFIACLLSFKNSFAQRNLLLNGSFEDINVCTEYTAECGVEGWFYLKDIQIQMLSNYDPELSLGNNSYGLFYKWIGYTGFTPVIGTILPCRLQEGKEYVFKGMMSAKFKGSFYFKAGVVIDEKFYVPNRPFSKTMRPDSISHIKQVKGKQFYEFEYRFIANGKEKYLTFGSFMAADETSGRRGFLGTQTITLIVDNFQLLAADSSEGICNNFLRNKENIYSYNYRHKEMDYSLFGKGDLDITFNAPDSNDITRYEPPKEIIQPDTLKLGDVFFDFNKSTLKPEAIVMMNKFFGTGERSTIDSIYIEGHTDSIGSSEQNMRLSMRRCESVQSWLVENAVVTKEQLQIYPFGKTRPVATNSTSRGRAQNRRVELIIFRRKNK